MSGYWDLELKKDVSEEGDDTCISSHALLFCFFYFAFFFYNFNLFKTASNMHLINLHSHKLTCRGSHTIKPLVWKTIAVFTLCHEHPNRHPFWDLPIEMGDKRGKRPHGKVPKPVSVFLRMHKGEQPDAVFGWVLIAALIEPRLSLSSSFLLSFCLPTCASRASRLCHADSPGLMGEGMKAIDWERNGKRCMHCVCNFICLLKYIVIHKIQIAEKNLMA